MNYLDFRANIKTGDILAFTHRSWNSWYDFKIQMVRTFTQSEYSHVGIAWVINGRVMILESVTGGIRAVPLSNFLPVYHLPWKELSQDQLEYAFSLMGQPYSQWEGIKALFGLNDKNNKKWECAEYVTAVHNMPCLAVPSSVVDYCLKNGSVLTELVP